MSYRWNRRWRSVWPVIVQNWRITISSELNKIPSLLREFFTLSFKESGFFYNPKCLNCIHGSCLSPTQWVGLKINSPKQKPFLFLVKYCTCRKGHKLFIPNRRKSNNNQIIHKQDKKENQKSKNKNYTFYDPAQSKAFQFPNKNLNLLAGLAI